MPAVPADLCIEARWIVPMTTPDTVLENHALVVRDGRILDLLPQAAAAGRYAPTVTVQRPAHLLMPGMINAATHAAKTLFRGTPKDAAALERRFVGPEFARDGVLTAIAQMLRAGITCFADRYYFPDQTARAAGEQGMRVVVGMPVAETASPWAGCSADYLTRALAVRDEYKGHPLISTAFAPHAVNGLSDATFARIATLADELDAGIFLDVHESSDEIAASVVLHGMRPLQRLWKLGLLTPALNAVHMSQATPQDIDLAQRTGISISLCPQSDLKQGGSLPPLAAMAGAAIRLSVASGDGAPNHNQDMWQDLKLLAAMACAGGAPHAAAQALAMATRGGAAALGLEAELGTLESGKWADICCADLGGPSTHPVSDPVTQLVFGGGRDIVSDVWVAGRQLLSEGTLTRLDWPGVAARAEAWAVRMNNGG